MNLNRLKRFVHLFSRIKTQAALYKLYLLATTGMGYGVANRLGVEFTGETQALNYAGYKSLGTNNFVCFDVGANVGSYSALVVKLLGEKISRVYAFEPSKYSFESLAKATESEQVISCYNFGFGDEETELTLWASFKCAGGSTIHNTVGRDYGNDTPEIIQIKVIDEFCALNDIEKIDFLKIDVEGHELFVLKGARQMLKKRAIQFIQFEFGPLHIYSRTFFKDFWDLLSPDYFIYRIVSDGIYEIRNYNENLEIFRTSNFLAELKQT